MVFSVSGWVVCVMLGRIGSIGVDECPTGCGGVGVIGWRTKDTRLLHPIFTLDPRGDVGPPREGTPETA